MNYVQTNNSVIIKLTKLVTILARQVSELERKNDSRLTRKSPATKQDILLQNRPPITCYTCGEPGHISRRCPKRNSEGQGQAQQNTIQNIIVINSIHLSMRRS
jgi:hypothetical protein